VSEILDQTFQCASVPPEMMDRLWESGWRHFGATFFRYNFTLDEHGIRSITPLRLDLEKFTLSKSQRRVLRRNEDVRCEFGPASLSDEAQQMFQRHKQRFNDHVPEGLETFLSESPATVPCPCHECRVSLGDELIAISFLDVGARATSAVYGLFEPEHSARSLGTYTMLKEIEYSQALGCRFYYPGYATHEPSPYDYKKQLHGLEKLDWEAGEWGPQARLKG
jgi:arginyl-tRNA--protein-N-Asp/Glu arginylyltransferase